MLQPLDQIGGQGTLNAGGVDETADATVNFSEYDNKPILNDFISCRIIHYHLEIEKLSTQFERLFKSLKSPNNPTLLLSRPPPKKNYLTFCN